MSSSADLADFYSALASMQATTSTRASRTRSRTSRLPFTVSTYRFTKTDGLIPSVYTTLITNPLTVGYVSTIYLSETSPSSAVETSQSSRSQSSAGAGASSSQVSSTASVGALAGQNAGSSSESHSGGISGGAIAAAVIVPIVVIAALIAGIVLFLRRRKQQHRLSSASTMQSFSNEPPPQMTMTERPRDSAGPPTLNHIVPGELENQVAVPAAAATANTSRWSGIRRGPSAVSRKPVAGSTTTPQIGDDVLRPVSPIHDTPVEAPRDPFATPTPASLANSPEDTPNYLNANANGTPIRNTRSHEMFMNDPTPNTGAVGRQWHSTNGSSRFNGRDPRMSPVGESSRPMSPADDVSDLDEDETVEIGEATVATTSTAHRQRASMIEMARLEGGSPPKESHL